MTYGLSKMCVCLSSHDTEQGGGNVPVVLESNQNHAKAEETEVCPCLPASMGLGGGYVPMIVEPICFRPEQTIKIDGGVLHSRWSQGNTKPRNVL